MMIDKTSRRIFEKLAEENENDTTFGSDGNYINSETLLAYLWFMDGWQASEAIHTKRIEELEAQIKRLTNAIETVLAVVESSLYLDDEELHNLQNKLEQALASKESIDG